MAPPYPLSVVTRSEVRRLSASLREVYKWGWWRVQRKTLCLARRRGGWLRPLGAARPNLSSGERLDLAARPFRLLPPSCRAATQVMCAHNLACGFHESRGSVRLGV